MPPLLADFSHARACKPFCEKYLTLPPTTTIQMEIVYNVGSHDVYSSHLQIKTAQTTILGGLRCFGIQNDS